ncbi:MAG: histidine kinase [Opitutaceae bacterium]|nr:histidine kinase [Opitutaceae bacterium]
MKEIEITEIPPLTPGEQSLLDLHSVVNILNVLRCELSVLGLMAADDDDYFHDGLAVSEALLRALHEGEPALREAARLEAYERTVFAELSAKLAHPPAQPEEKEVVEILANLRSVFAILKVRAHEILARAAAPQRWEAYDTGHLRAELRAVFAAIEKHSRGRYRILYNAARKEDSDYYVDFRLEVANGTVAWMPPVFQDVMRDLIANARKYTAPGGHITVALYQDGVELRFVVSDTGRGIPEAELAQVVEFGRRASNVGNVRTLGGGFGLTKAFLVTKRFGGRFWIASEEGVGTRLRIVIPMPDGVGAPVVTAS